MLQDSLIRSLIKWLLAAGIAWTVFIQGSAIFQMEISMNVHADIKVHGEAGVSGGPRAFFGRRGEADPRAVSVLVVDDWQPGQGAPTGEVRFLPTTTTTYYPLT
jgi:hypothetical protein